MRGARLALVAIQGQMYGAGLLAVENRAWRALRATKSACADWEPTATFLALTYESDDSQVRFLCEPGVDATLGADPLAG